MRRLRALWRHHRAAMLLFCAALAVTVFFVVRMAIFAVYWSDPSHRAQPPEPWMTPRYIAHSWGLDPGEVARGLGLPETIDDDRPTLEEIAEHRGVPVEQVIAEVREMIAATEPRQ